MITISSLNRIECLFEDLPHILVDLENISQAIDGYSSVTVRIHFRPIASVQYQESLNFLINSASEKNVIIRGEGISYKVIVRKMRYLVEMLQVT